LALVKKRIVRISIAVLSGMVILAGVVWLFSRSLGNKPSLYTWKSLNDWRQPLESHDAGASNQAYEVLNTQVIPRLVEQMFHDTNDSKLRLSLIKALNGIPGVGIDFTEARDRRISAANALGTIGPPAKAAVPSLIQALKWPDFELDEAAIRALGGIHSSPDVVIPLLMPYLNHTNGLTVEAIVALGNYGSLAREAFPKIAPIMQIKWKDGRAAAKTALKQIDPEAAAQEGVN
jgi:hypothetical protein